MAEKGTKGSKERQENMKQFRDVIGRERITEYLQNAIRLDRVSHAYIFYGEEGIGKNFIADIFVAALQCEMHSGEPCGECKSCLQAAGGNHPDIIRIHREKAAIGVDDIRSQINNDIAIKPYSSRYKIYIIDEAEKMTEAAQNALLKTIEEPPEYAVILLLTDNVNAFLPTILSRCVMIHMKPVDKERLKEHLMQDCNIPDYQAELAATFAAGNVGRAERYAVSAEFEGRKNEVMHLVSHIDEMKSSEIMDFLKRFSGEKAVINDYIDLIFLWYRDVLMFKATRQTAQLIYKEEILTLQKQAAGKSFEALQHIIEAFEALRARLKANVNFDAAMELLLLALQEK